MEKENIVTLVEAAQAGSSDAISELFAAYKNEVYSIAMRETKDRALSDDIVQETFVEVILKIKDLKNPESFHAWLKIMAYHQCTRHYKKKETVHETAAVENDEGWSVFDTVEETNASFVPDEALDQKEFKATILEMIADLPDAHRTALHMFYFEEIPLKDIAAAQGVSVNTANTRLNRGRLAMKDSIEKYEKKHGIRLHTIAFFHFFKWLLKGSDEAMSTKSATKVAQRISAETGLSISASSTAIAAEATSATVSSVSTTVASSAGAAGVKAVTTSIISKVIAGVVAVSVAVGGTALYLDGNQENKHGDVSVQTEQNNSPGLESEPTVPTTIPTEASTKKLSDILDFSQTWSHIQDWENNTFCTSYVFEEDGSFYCNVGWFMSDLITAYTGTYTYTNDILTLSYNNDNESFVCDYKLDAGTLILEQLSTKGIGSFQNQGDRFQLYVETLSNSPDKVKEQAGYFYTKHNGVEITTEMLNYIQLPNSFIFTSGAGGWATKLSVADDGTFSGQYHDSEMGAVGEGYPRGMVYYCNFYGYFSDISKISDHVYHVSLDYLEIEDAPGTKHIEDGILYEAADAYGLAGAFEIYIYTPGTPMKDIPTACLSWMIGRAGSEYLEDVFVLYNAHGECAFISE